jgi:pSer/pThr/pTyr-binding forkhead associated (FHA) protein/serine/threonine protein kinase
MPTGLAPGVFVGTHQIVRSIWNGAVGEIYEVVGDPLLRRGLLKTSPAAAALAARFTVRTNTLMSVRHPNLAGVHDAGQFPTPPGSVAQLYWVQDLIEGGTLEEWIAGLGSRGAKAALSTALDMILPVVDALAVCHEAGLAHGAVSPRNIFLHADHTGTIEPILSDARFELLGIVTEDDERAYWAYQPPELVTGGAAGAATENGDQYALAVTLLECLAGRIDRSVDNGDFAPRRLIEPSGFLAHLNRERADLPQEVGRILMRALSVHPHDRFPSVRAFGQALLPFREREAPIVEVRRFEREGAQPTHQPAPPDGDPPVRLDENVQFTVFRPRALSPSRWYPFLAFAHLSERRPDAPSTDPDPAEELQRQAQEVLGDHWKEYRQTSQDAVQAIPREGDLTFVPHGEGLEFQPERVSFRWSRSVHKAEFSLRAAGSAVGTTVRGRVTVFLGSIIVADVPFGVTVETEAGAPALEAACASPYRKIFASYSHRDAPIVRQFELLARALGDRYIVDWVELRSGESWETRLRGFIREADVFQLFWSWNSMRAPYVRQEWEYALSLNRKHFVRPTYWQEPMPSSEAEGLPSPPLRAMHFARIPWVESPPETSVAPQPTSIPPLVCDRCGKENRDHYKFCLGCGNELEKHPVSFASKAKNGIPWNDSPKMAAAFAPAPLAAPNASGSRMAAIGGAMCRNCDNEIASGFAFCGKCGTRVAAPPSAGAGVRTMFMLAPAGASAAVVPAGRLILIRPDGSEGGVYPLFAGANIIGRGQGVLFDGDRFLSPRHGEIEIGSQGVTVRDLESLNGIFIKIAHEEPLASGDLFRVGQQLIRFDSMGPQSPLDDGTEIMGSPNPGYWGRLLLLIGRDVVAAAFPLRGDAIAIGRDKADIPFPDDNYVSRTHARLSARGGSAYLSDLGSTNGTFLKIRAGRVALPSGTIILIGQQVFRVDYP